jgi:rRNA-processing protein FCF1
MAKEREVLVVASKVRAYIKSKKMMTSSEAIPAISDMVYRRLDRAAERAKANRRSTIKAQDL